MERGVAEELLGVDGNDVCADCPAQRPDWAVINLGIFVCLQCSAVHRALGTHISQVYVSLMCLDCCPHNFSIGLTHSFLHARSQAIT